VRKHVAAASPIGKSRTPMRGGSDDLDGLREQHAFAGALDAGANAYYTKPFSPMALLKEIEGVRSRSDGSMPVPPPKPE
jgi:hypothetical protein